MKSINIVVCGARGHMGRQILSLLEESSLFHVRGAVEVKGHAEIGAEIAPGVVLVDELDSVLTANDVVIEFTSPAATLAHAQTLERKQARAVIGTTGLHPKQLARIEAIGENVPVVLSPNMGVGVNIMFYLVEEMARLLPDFDIEVIEAHHNRKKDAPSGTAAKIAQVLAQARNGELASVGVYGRHGATGPRPKEEIGVHAIRAGSIVGEHTVLFAGDSERLELTHRAGSRRLFARGALVAAEFVSKQSPGLYDFQDVLGLRKDSHD